MDKDGKGGAGLAEKYGDDQLTWTFHLRNGLKWSDSSSQPMILYTAGRGSRVDPNVAAPYAQTVLGMVEEL